MDKQKLMDALLKLVVESIEAEDSEAAFQKAKDGFTAIGKELDLAIESTVNERVASERQEIEKELDAKYASELETFSERNKLYAESAIQEFLTENKDSLVTESQNNVGKRFFDGLANLVGESFVTAADGSKQIEKLSAEVAELKEMANKAEARALTAESEVQKAQFKVLVTAVGAKLPDAERLMFESRCGKNYDLTKEDMEAILNNDFLKVNVAESAKDTSEQVQSENEKVQTNESNESEEDSEKEVAGESQEESTRVVNSKHAQLLYS